jgi:hypothetical protein
MALGDTEISFSAKIRHRNNLRTRKIRLDLKYKKMSPLILNITGLFLEKCSYAPDKGRPDYHNIIMNNLNVTSFCSNCTLGQ